MNEYRVVTVTNRIPNEWYYLQREFFKSLGNTQPVVITGGGEQWGGLTTKPKWLYRVLKEKMVEEKYIIFPDNWDLVFAVPCDDIFDLYKMMGYDVIISAEKNCFPEDTKDDYDRLNNIDVYRYLNSGFIIGRTDAIIACLEEMDLPSVPNDYYDEVEKRNVHPNDQLLWQQVYLKQPVNIYLDCQQQFSQTLHGADIGEFDFSGRHIRNKITNTCPATFHFNGGAKDNLSIREPILKHLNLS